MYNTKVLKNAFPVILFLLFTVCWGLFYRNCIDEKDWWIENILVFLSLIILIKYYPNFKFSNGSYLCLLCFLLLHIYGARYAYTQNIFGEWLQTRFTLNRNPYDRIVHFSFGLFLYVPLQDFLKNKVKIQNKYIPFLGLNILLSLACIFELIEWGVSECTSKATGETYVATQGDVWDAHKDIALAVVGAVCTICILYFTKGKEKRAHEYHIA